MCDTISLLLVDDDPMDREEIRVMLGKGYALDEACNGEEGWNKLTTGKYAAIVLDLDLGKGMDGFDFLTAMRQEGVWLPVVIISKTGDIDRVVRAMKLGASNFVGKQAGGVEVEIALQKALAELQLARDNLIYREQIDAAKGSLVSCSKSARALLDEIECLVRVTSGDARLFIGMAEKFNEVVVAHQYCRSHIVAVGNAIPAVKAFLAGHNGRVNHGVLLQAFPVLIRGNGLLRAAGEMPFADSTCGISFSF